MRLPTTFRDMHGKIFGGVLILALGFAVAYWMHMERARKDEQQGRISAAPQVSDTSRKLLEEIELLNDAVNKEKPSSGKDTLTLHFREVKSIEAFQRDLAMWTLEKQTKLHQSHLQMYLQSWGNEAIVPSQAYSIQEFNRRVTFMEKTLDLLFEVGDPKDAEKIANSLLDATTVGILDLPEPEAAVFKLAVRVQTMWKLATSLNIDERFDDALSLLAEGLESWRPNRLDVAKIIAEDLAAKHLWLAQHNRERAVHLDAAKQILDLIMSDVALTGNGLITYGKVLAELGDYHKAFDVLSRGVELLGSKEKVKPESLKLSELVFVAWLSILGTPAKFLEEFGPFAAPILADSKKIYLADAWQQIYNKPIEFSDRCEQARTGLLIDNVVVYEESSDPVLAGQGDIIAHELIHKVVEGHTKMRSEGIWYSAQRDIPTAALDTYLRQIARSHQLNRPLPDCLRAYVELGSQAVRRDQKKSAYHIKNMLAFYFSLGTETSGAYRAAAILAGMLLGILGEPDSDVMNLYLGHLMVTSHEKALDRAQRHIELEFKTTFSVEPMLPRLE